MSFVASNNRIRVVDNGATVFDTDDDMPHILGTGTYSLTVTFPQPSLSARIDVVPRQEYKYVETYVCRDVVTQQYQCKTVCGYETTYSYQCSSDFMGNTSCGYVPVTTYVCRNQCGYVPVSNRVCGFEGSWQWVTVYDNVQTQSYNSLEWSQQYILGDLPFGQSCNFFLIKATAVRTATGGTKAQPGDLIATVGNETFSFQGSALLEAGGQQSGSRFLSRIISVIPDNVNKKLILEAKHSNNYYDMPWASGAARSLSSTFAVTLTVYFGRFR
jgi:hypothetical protein